MINNVFEVVFNIQFCESEDGNVLFINIKVETPEGVIELPDNIIQIHQPRSSFPKIFIVGCAEDEGVVGINTHLLQAILEEFQNWRLANVVEKN